jgi:hypothetical protein
MKPLCRDMTTAIIGIFGPDDCMTFFLYRFSQFQPDCVSCNFLARVLLVLNIFGGMRKVARDGIEPPTQRFSVSRSTD